MKDQNLTESFATAITTYYYKFLDFLPKVVLAILVITLGTLFAQFISNIYKKRIRRKATDPLMAAFLAQAIKIILVIIAIMIALQVAGWSAIAAGVLTAAGGAAIVLGFAFQDIGKNFLAGIILAFNRPFNINDTIMIGDIFGKVRALSFRYTHLKTFNGRDIFIPNSDVLTKPVENYTADGFFRNEFVVGIGYEDNIEAAKKLIVEILNEQNDVVQNDPEHENFVVESELAASTVNLKVFFWVKTIDYRVSSLILRGLVIKKVKEALEKAGFNLPADITELKLYSNEEDIPLRVRKDPRDLLDAADKLKS
ncbi:mechanosensitive ion channel family protein [Haloflavibacter putidus]|uniref:Mechanosensitive ion channel family protein n=1 Tax=Haloflavibacter putidus TaxID=2576776 RepID=A0A507ZQT5_9FLAO|nr:mechanosensitive ion channel family protein [Haloflavibacter putidus]TQD38893.1 mechanosensitive ion channel family protein [Haloflavibacter putidus]